MSNALVCLEMGDVFQREGNFPAAADAFTRAIKIDPEFARCYYCMGNLYREINEQAQALNYYNKAIEIDDSVADFYNNRGLLSYEMGNPEDSEADFLEAISLDARHVLAINNLGVLYQCLNQNEKARKYFERAIEVDPTYSSSYYNLGNFYSGDGQQDKAIACFDKVISLASDKAHAFNAKSIALLLKGQYLKGWELHEWRWKTNYKPFANGAPEGVLWLGEESLQGKTILIQSEQGLGDTLQFCRYLPLLAERGANIIFQTENSLIELMHSLEVKMQIIPMDAPAPRVDYYCPLLSLPLIFKTILENIPSSAKNAKPYLSANPEKMALWRSKINQASHGDKLRVGLVWAGAPRFQALSYRGLNSRRDIPLKTLFPLIQEDFAFYSLQKGAAAQLQLQELEPALRNRITDWTNDLESFADTAAFVENLDVIVTVDTSIVHLAGAMGKPVFLLNRKDTCWRWLEMGEHSPWYPSVTVFRQTEILQWDDVIQNVISRLRELKPSKINS